MDKSYITIKDLSKKFNENKIIDNLSIEIDKGDLVKISGRNGSGKTTFLKILSQLYTFEFCSFKEFRLYQGGKAIIVFLDNNISLKVIFG